jgi:NitT/TauT family transport system substrate-binding protein
MTTRQRIAALCTLLLALAAACGSGGGDDGSALRVGLIPFNGYAPLYIADEFGVRDEHGVELELVETEGQSGLDALMASGDLDVGAYANTSLVFAAAGGVPLQAFLTLAYSVGADGSVTDGSVGTIAEIAESQATFGTDESDVAYFLFMSVAQREGFEPGDFNLVQLPARDALTAFFSEDLAVAGMAEPLLSRSLEREGAQLLFTTADHPTLLNDVFVASRGVIDARAAELSGFRDCWYATLEVLRDRHDESMAVMADALGVEVADMELLNETIIWPGEEDGAELLTSGELAEILDFAIDLYADLDLLAGEQVDGEALVTTTVVDGS